MTSLSNKARKNERKKFVSVGTFIRPCLLILSPLTYYTRALKGIHLVFTQQNTSSCTVHSNGHFSSKEWEFVWIVCSSKWALKKWEKIYDHVALWRLNWFDKTFNE